MSQTIAALFLRIVTCERCGAVEEVRYAAKRWRGRRTQRNSRIVMQVDTTRRLGRLITGNISGATGPSTLESIGLTQRSAKPFALGG